MSWCTVGRFTTKIGDPDVIDHSLCLSFAEHGGQYAVAPGQAIDASRAVASTVVAPLDSWHAGEAVTTRAGAWPDTDLRRDK